MTVPHEAGTKTEETTGDALAESLRAGDPVALVGYYRGRSAAALAACSRLCAPERIGEALEQAFAEVFEAAGAGDANDEQALDRRLRAAVRSAAAERFGSQLAVHTGAPTAGARRVADRVAGTARSSACDHMPRLLAARPEGLLGAADLDRMQEHLRRCPACAAAEARFDEADRAFDSVAAESPPASVERALVARFAALLPAAEEPAPVISVPDGALDGLVDDEEEPADLEHAPAEGIAVVEPEPDEPEEGWSDDFAAIEDADVVGEELPEEPFEEPFDESAPLDRARAYPRTRPLGPPPRLHDDTAEWEMPEHVDEPASDAPPRRRRRVPRALAGVAVLALTLLAAWGATTALWKEPVSAVLTSSGGNGGTPAAPKPGAVAAPEPNITAAPAAPAAAPTAAERREAARLKALGRRDLAVGMTGEDVRTLQKLVGAPATGYFGPATEAALRQFQADRGLPQTGRADAATKRALARRNKLPPAPVTPAAGTGAAAPQQPAGPAAAAPPVGAQRGPAPGGAAAPPPGTGGGAAAP